MSYEYIVNIPADKRAAFRKYVASLGGRLSRAKKVVDKDEPNELTAKVLKEVESGINVEPFDFNAFHAYAKSL
ncbi:MAG: hypothetical protein IJU69_00515 [Bacteroidales bacterium]|nr:hypothetical protein [Bacteroidales bacterium]